MNDDYHPLTLEQTSVLVRLLTRPFPGSDQLLQQVHSTLGREIDSDGSLSLRPPPEPRASVKYQVPVEAEVDDLDGVVIHVSLHVQNGLLKELEIYREDSAPVARALVADELRVMSY